MEFSWQLGVPAQLRNIIDALAQRFREGVEQVPLTMTIPIDAREEHIQDKLLNVHSAIMPLVRADSLYTLSVAPPAADVEGEIVQPGEIF